MKNALAGTAAAAAEAAATASAASASAAAAASDAASSRHSEQRRAGATTATPAFFAADDDEASSRCGARTDGGGVAKNSSGSNGGGAVPCTAQPQEGSGAMYYGSRAGREGRAVVAPTSRGLSREEARLLIRAELKRAGISEKITRCVFPVWPTRTNDFSPLLSAVAGRARRGSYRCEAKRTKKTLDSLGAGRVTMRSAESDWLSASGT